MTFNEYRLEVLRLFEHYEIRRRDQQTIDAVARLFQSIDRTPMSTYPLNTLRRWAAGKHTTTAQITALIKDGYIYTTTNGETLATTKGINLLKTGKDL